MKKIFTYALVALATVAMLACSKPADNEKEEEKKEEAPAYPTDYASYTEVSTWGITGSIASTGNDWGQTAEDKDIVMKTNGTWHVATGVVLTTTDQFKFRKDNAWTENRGGICEEAGKLFDVAQNGDNIKVPADGTYTLLLNAEEGKAVVIAE